MRWRVATVAGRRVETSSAVTLILDVPEWPGHLAGQHVDLRLTAEDGYSTQRSYSIASAWAPAPASASGPVEVTIQRVPDGEVSPYLADEVRDGDQLEVRGPVGGWFVWRPEQAEPVLLVAGGSGIVPLMAMVRARRLASSRAPFRLLYSVRTPTDRMYLQELDAAEPGLEVAYLFTRTAPPGWDRAPARIGPSDLAQTWPAAGEPSAYVCGPTGFVEHVADTLVDLGHKPDRIRTERFGPTGG